MANTPFSNPPDSDSALPASKPPTCTQLEEQPLLHFGLRQLFWFVAVVSVLLAGMSARGGMTALALLLAALIVALHVASTMIGGRLRAQADERIARETGQVFSEHIHRSAAEGVEGHPHVELAPRSPWHGRGVTPLPWLRPIIVAGVLIGGLGGAFFLTLTIGHRTSPAGIAVGAISLAVLGGWLGFLGSSFYGIARHGLREALAEQQKDEARHKPGR